MSRSVLYRAVGLSGLNRLARTAFQRHPLVLCYHGVCGPSPDVPDLAGLHVPAPLFEAQMRWLLRSYEPVSLTQWRAHFLEGAPLSPAAVLVTFDDGYRNVARHALPLLRKWGIPCVLFVVPALVDADAWLWTSELEWRRAGDPALPELKRRLKSLPAPERRRCLKAELDRGAPRPECDYSLLNWDELAAEVDAGGVEIGSHGLHHEPLTTCSAAELQTELVESKRRIREQLLRDPETIAYPNGSCSPAVVTVARESGYRLGFTTVPRHSHGGDDPLVLPRIQVGRCDTPPVLAARLAGWQEWLRRLRSSPGSEG